MKKKLFFVIALTCSFGFISCSDDKKTDEPTVEQPGNNVPSVGLLDPTEAKDYMKETASILADKIVPSEQSILINAANYFCNNYGDLEVPTEWEDAVEGDSRVSNPLTNTMSAISRSLESGDYTLLSRAGTDYLYAFKDFTGVFEPGKYEWKKVEDSKDIVFRWKEGGRQCEAKAVAEGGTYSVKFEDTWYDWDYDYSKDDYIKIKHTDNYTINAPKKVTLTFYRDGEKLVDAVINDEYDKNAHTLRVNADVKAMNIQVVTVLNGTDSEIVDETSVAISNEVVVATKVKANGRKLCDEDAIRDLIDDLDDEKYASVDNYFNNGTFEVNVLGRVQLKGSMKHLGDVLESGDYESYERYNSNASKDARYCANTLNNNLECKMYFSGNSTVQGAVEFQAYGYEGYWSNEWLVEPVLVFESDASRYTFEEYFGKKKFSSTQNLYENLFNKYEAMWK